MNDKIDLVEAESIADLIDSQSKHAYQSALRSLSGEFSNHIHNIVSRVIDVRVYVEAALDFPEEEVDFLKDQALLDKMLAVQNDLEQTLLSAQEGKALREGLHLVILGKPNAGKSSLLNALAGTEAAIVTDIPGTTRDTVEQTILVDGLPIHIVDTAGIRETRDEIEQLGIVKAHEKADKAEHLFLIIDANDPDDMDLYETYRERSDMTIIRNKIDLIDGEARQSLHHEHVEIWVSVKQALGLDLIKQRLRSIAGLSSNENSAFSARTRHITSLEVAKEGMSTSLDMLRAGQSGELIAEELTLVQNQLSMITGTFTSDDLLGEIFGSFCIGK